MGYGSFIFSRFGRMIASLSDIEQMVLFNISYQTQLNKFVKGMKDGSLKQTTLMYVERKTDTDSEEDDGQMQDINDSSGESQRSSSSQSSIDVENSEEEQSSEG